MAFLFLIIYLYNGGPAPASSTCHLHPFRFAAIFTRFSTRLGLGLGLEFKQGTLEHRAPLTFALALAHTLRSIFSRHS
jgi:hypothetical protein